ncbi:MAG: hypothetical protein LH603_02955 [Pseudonocardia sp.]|nr:hypothetical protein [Pseudonocardia sp.]
MTGSQAAPAELLRIEIDRAALLVGLLRGDDPHLRAETLRIAEKKPSGCDIAVDLLVDLREVCDPVEFASRLDWLRRKHGRKVTFVELLGHAGLQWKRCSPRRRQSWRCCGRRMLGCGGCLI